MDMRKEGRGRRAGARSLVGSDVAPERILPGDATTTRAAAQVQTSDLDLLRLSYVFRADTLLHGLPERSRVLSTIHRFFDAAPDRASAESFPLSALIDHIRARAASQDGA